MEEIKSLKDSYLMEIEKIKNSDPNIIDFYNQTIELTDKYIKKLSNTNPDTWKGKYAKCIFNNFLLKFADGTSYFRDNLLNPENPELELTPEEMQEATKRRGMKFSEIVKEYKDPIKSAIKNCNKKLNAVENLTEEKAQKKYEKECFDVLTEINVTQPVINTTSNLALNSSFTQERAR